MNEDESIVRRALVVGGLIGALIGAGAAYVLVKYPAGRPLDQTSAPIKTKDLLSLTKTLTDLVDQLDNVRRKT